MKIIVFGAGAVGSFFGGILSKNNKVYLIGRKTHIDSINRHGLKISGKTSYTAKVKGITSANEIDFIPDLLIFSVKSYDTLDGVKQACSLMEDNTLFLSIQNGLDNIKKISKYVKNENIGACVTTNGVVFEKPGFVEHTGVGGTVLGMFNKKNDARIQKVLQVFNQVGIESVLSEDIEEDIWFKGIVNSCINPLTAFFNCKNGYLLKNPVLTQVLSKICFESCRVAFSQGIDVPFSEMFEKTKNVVKCTEENYSSMLQSVKKNKKTEIDSINGEIVKTGLKNDEDVFLNKVLVDIIKNSF